MERNVTNLLTLGNRIHVICEDVETGKLFLKDAYSEGFRWKDDSRPETISYCRIHHNRLLSSYGTWGGAMAWHNSPEAFYVNYKLWKSDAEQFLKSSPKLSDPRIYNPLRPKRKDTRSRFEKSILSTTGEAAYEKLQYDGRDYLIPLLKSEEGGFAWRDMISVHGTYNREYLEKSLAFYCGTKLKQF